LAPLIFNFGFVWSPLQAFDCSLLAIINEVIAIIVTNLARNDSSLMSAQLGTALEAFTTSVAV
jgi:hypothetical protein